MDAPVLLFCKDYTTIPEKWPHIISSKRVQGDYVVINNHQKILQMYQTVYEYTMTWRQTRTPPVISAPSLTRSKPRIATSCLVQGNQFIPQLHLQRPMGNVWKTVGRICTLMLEWKGLNRSKIWKHRWLPPKKDFSAYYHGIITITAFHFLLKLVVIFIVVVIIRVFFIITICDPCGLVVRGSFGHPLHNFLFLAGLCQKLNAMQR